MKEVSELLRELAAKLGTTVEYLWRVLVKQGQIEGIKSVVIFIAALIIVPIIFKIAAKFNILKDEEGDFKESSIGVFVLCGFFIIGSIVNLFININGLLNPEYWALQEILNKIR